MKFLKKPAAAFLIAFVIVICSTLWSGKVRLERDYDLVRETLCESVMDFANDKGLPELASEARALSHLDGSKEDYDDLIRSCNEAARDYAKRDTKAVDRAIKKFSRFEEFPATLFARLWNVS